eukprot:scaffold11676_cov130-Isochrysis_galbana.AAC.5
MKPSGQAFWPKRVQTGRAGWSGAWRGHIINAAVLRGMQRTMCQMLSKGQGPWACALPTPLRLTRPFFVFACLLALSRY